jgi:signal recognition particle GTPase
MPEVIDSEPDLLSSADAVDGTISKFHHTLSMRGRRPPQKLASTATVRDVVLETELDMDISQTISQGNEDEPSNTAEIHRQAQKTSQEKRKLVIIMVGLPGRGKTYLCNKLVCYLDWCDLLTVFRRLLALALPQTFLCKTSL